MQNIKVVVPEILYNKMIRFFDRNSDTKLTISSVIEKDESLEIEVIATLDKDFNVIINSKNITIPDNFTLYLDSVYDEDTILEENELIMLQTTNSGLYMDLINNKFVSVDSTITIGNIINSNIGHSLTLIEGLSDKVLNRFESIKNDYKVLPKTITNITDLKINQNRRTLYFGSLDDNPNAVVTPIIYGEDDKKHIYSIDGHKADMDIVYICHQDTATAISIIGDVVKKKEEGYILLDTSDLSTIDKVLSDDELSDESFIIILIIVELLNTYID